METEKCIRCDRVPEPGLVTCRPCLDKANQAALAKAAKAIPGKVCRCGKAIDREDRKTCSSCRGHGRRTYRRALATTANLGVCRSCDNETMPDYTQCRDCWWKKKSLAHFKTVTLAKALQQLWESQNRNCALSGLPIDVPYMELDHILPLARSGENTMDNVQWTLSIVNRMKGSLTPKEFLELCQTVASAKPNLVSDAALLEGASQHQNRVWKRKQKGT